MANIVIINPTAFSITVSSINVCSPKTLVGIHTRLARGPYNFIKVIVIDRTAVTALTSVLSITLAIEIANRLNRRFVCGALKSRNFSAGGEILRLHVPS